MYMYICVYMYSSITIHFHCNFRMSFYVHVASTSVFVSCMMDIYVHMSLVAVHMV